MLYKTKKKECYVALLPNGFASHLQVKCCRDGDGKYVMRLTDMHDVTGYNCKVEDARFGMSDWRKKKEKPIYSYGSTKISCSPCEVSFSLDEAEKIISWALDNYIEVKFWHPDLAAEFCNEDHLGKPLGYVWTKKGKEENKLIESKKFRSGVR